MNNWTQNHSNHSKQGQWMEFALSPPAARTGGQFSDVCAGLCSLQYHWNAARCCFFLSFCSFLHFFPTHLHLNSAPPSLCRFFSFTTKKRLLEPARSRTTHHYKACTNSEHTPISLSDLTQITHSDRSTNSHLHLPHRCLSPRSFFNPKYILWTF